MQFTDSVRSLKGVGDKIEKNLNKLGIFTVEDLLEYYPRTYQTYDAPVDVSEVTPGKRCERISTSESGPDSRRPGGKNGGGADGWEI